MSQLNDNEPRKSSAEILSELFSTFNALPPILKDKVLKKHKKSKKKHKRKDRKHKKKSKHKYNSESSNDESSDDSYENLKKRVKKEQTSNDEKSENVGDKHCEFDPNIVIKNEPGNEELQKDDETNVVSTTVNDTLEHISVKSQSNSINTEQDKEKSVKHKEIVAEETPDKVINKITIKNLKNSTVYEATIKEIEDKARDKATKFEDGEVTSESEDEIDTLTTNIPFEKSISSNSSRSEKKRKDRSKEKSKSDIINKRKKEKRKNRSRSRSKDKDRHSSRREKSDYYSLRYHKESSSYDRNRDKDRDRYKDDRSRDDRRCRDNKSSRSRDRANRSSRSRDRANRRSRSRDRDNRRSRSRDRGHRRSRSREKRRSRSKSRDERRSRSKDKLQSKFGKDYRSERKRRSTSPSSSIDKKKLLEIARKNAINMLKSGTLPEALTLGPQAQEKVIAAIKAGGKTIEELTDFCKNLSKKEELGELSSVSSNEDEIDSASESEKVFHHPFQLKDKPTSIVMNIKNATPLPVKNPKEKSAELRMQFPVSSGQLHRKTENEWVPVSPKKPELPSPLPIEAPPPLSVPEPVLKPAIIPPIPAPVTPVFPVVQPLSEMEVDISSIVSQRLNAMRKLQENPNDVQALNQMYKVQQEMQSWATSKQQIGQFTGSTGAQILTPAELSSGYQAWARKDQLQNAAPVTGGMGMHLLQKMGWKPGEGLGKEKTGSLEPLLLEVKLDKKGLVANEEVKTKKPVKVVKPTMKTLSGKHPVSLLGEYATKRKLGVPQYECCFECGPDHKKNFLFKVIVNGVEYKANIASSTKKQAKADAATVCLQQLGLLTS